MVLNMKKTHTETKNIDDHISKINIPTIEDIIIEMQHLYRIIV